jgi:serine/threonine-protein kinase
MTDPHQPLFSSPGYEPSGGTPTPDAAPPAGYSQAAAGSAYPQIGLSGGPALGRGPATSTPERRRYLLIAGAALTVIALVVVAVATLTGSGDSGSTAASQTRPAGTDQRSESSGAGSGGEPARSETTGRPTPTQSVPPPLVQSPDSYDESCGNGFHVTGRSGWATNSGRGSSETSCSFARSVLLAYWNQNGSASMDPRTVVAGGKVACPTTGGRCAGNDFVMECAVFGSDPWITCTGGRNARVYIY